MLKRALFALYFLLVFLLGFWAAQVWDSSAAVTGRVVDTPSNFIDNNKIEVFPDKVIIKVEDAKISSYDSTGSMLPTLGPGMNGISVAPSSPDAIKVGDIVSFRKGDVIVVHRVVQKGSDAEGIYFVTKGDNSEVEDGKIRFDDIERVLVAVVY